MAWAPISAIMKRFKVTDSDFLCEIRKYEHFRLMSAQEVLFEWSQHTISHKDA